jgi:hypothetical protein
MRRPDAWWRRSFALAVVAGSGMSMAWSTASAQADGAAAATVADAGAPDTSAAEPAAVAMEPAVEPAAATASADSSAVDAFLGTAMTEVPSLEVDGPSLQLYGFADLNITRPYLSKKSPFHDLADSAPFGMGNINVYLASNLTHGFSSLIEVRLTYMPSGSFDPTGKVQTTYALDASSYGRSERWGGIVLQRVHLDYSYNGMLNVRVGQFLTPYGIWNVDHGSPTVIPQFKPYPIGNQYLPERQVGLEVFGTYLVKNTTLGYHLTLSNGRGDVETADYDKNKALGGRLFVANDNVGALKVGLSAYGGRATHDVSVGIASGASGVTSITQVSGNQFDEFALAGDLLWEWKNVRIQGEGIVSQVRYTDDGRRLVTTQLGAPLGLVADHVAWAWYGLIGYRLPWLSTMPFVLIDQYKHAVGAGPPTTFNVGNEATGYNFGLNVRPIPSVVLKCQVSLVRSSSVVNSDATLVGGQAAWAF